MIRKLALLVLLLAAAFGAAGCSISDMMTFAEWGARLRRRQDPHEYWRRYASEEIRQERLCPACRGAGADVLGFRCRRCGGTGYAR